VESQRLALSRTYNAIAMALALVATFGLVASAEAADKPAKGPGGSKFYTPPSDYPNKHGKVIWQRKAGGLSPIDGARSNTLLLYVSKTPAGDKTATSGVVSVPEGKAPKKGWPVITYAHGTTGAADPCAPSRVTASSLVAPYVEYIDPELEDWIDAGYAVVQTDYQGLGTPGPHEYLIRQAEGRAVIDLVLAARRLNSDIGSKYLIAGHSQGGHAALSAAGLAQKYGNGIKLRGTVAFAPASQIAEQVDLLPSLTAPSGLSALAALILEGASSFDPAVDENALLNPEPLALFPQVEQTCLPQLVEPDSFGGIAPSKLINEYADTGPLLNVLSAQNPAVKTTAPIFIAQGTADTTVFPFLTNELANQLVAKGNDVDYQEYPGVTHGEIPSAAEPQTLEFFEQRLPAGN